MRVALVQGTPTVGAKGENIQYMRETIENNNAEFYVFGELYLTGYAYAHILDTAEPIPGDAVNEMATIAQDNDCYVVFGMPERARDRIYNVSVLLHPDGHIDRYRKWHLPNFGVFEEKRYFSHGSELQVFDTALGKLGLLICYDIFFPELAKYYALNGADLLVCISASPKFTRKHFERVMRARAIENTVFVLYTNLVGLQADLDFWGGNTIVDPRGEVKAKGKYFEEQIVGYEINLSEVERARPLRPVIADTRPDAFEHILSGFDAQKK